MSSLTDVVASAPDGLSSEKFLLHIKKEFETGRLTVDNPNSVIQYNNMTYEVRYFENYRSAYWALTNRCNQGCRHCYMGAMPDSFEGLDMDSNKHIADQLKGFNMISFSGGDPLTRMDDLLELLTYISQNRITENITIITTEDSFKGEGRGFSFLQELTKLNLSIHITVPAREKWHATTEGIADKVQKETGMLGISFQQDPAREKVIPLGRALLLDPQYWQMEDIPCTAFNSPVIRYSGQINLTHNRVSLKRESLFLNINPLGDVYSCIYFNGLPFGNLSHEDYNTLEKRIYSNAVMLDGKEIPGDESVTTSEFLCKQYGLTEQEQIQLEKHFLHCGTIYLLTAKREDIDRFSPLKNPYLCPEAKDAFNAAYRARFGR